MIDYRGHMLQFQSKSVRRVRSHKGLCARPRITCKWRSGRRRRRAAEQGSTYSLLLLVASLRPKIKLGLSRKQRFFAILRLSTDQSVCAYPLDMPPIRAMLHATSPQSQVIYSGAAARRAPLEVLEKIADDVDDNASLASCSLVCRIWSAAARRHRFRVVEISFEWPRENQRFTPISLLCDPTSTVLPFVQEMHLTDSERYGGDRIFKLPS